MYHPNGDQPNGPDEERDDGIDDGAVQRSLDRFFGTLHKVENHKRRIIDALGWWIIRATLAVAFVVLLVFSRAYEACICAGLFALTFLARSK